MPFFFAADYAAVGLDFSVRIMGGLALTPRAGCELDVDPAKNIKRDRSPYVGFLESTTVARSIGHNLAKHPYRQLSINMSSLERSSF
jgi:hypothetical protein